MTSRRKWESGLAVTSYRCLCVDARNFRIVRSGRLFQIVVISFIHDLTYLEAGIVYHTVEQPTLVEPPIATAVESKHTPSVLNAQPRRQFPHSFDSLIE